MVALIFRGPSLSNILKKIKDMGINDGWIISTHLQTTFDSKKEKMIFELQLFYRSHEDPHGTLYELDE